MPLYTPVDFNAAYSLNKSGKLTEDQITAIEFVLKARSVTGIILFFCDLLLALLFGGVTLSGSWETDFAQQLIFLAGTLVFAAGALYGWNVWFSVKQAKQKLATLVIEKIVGEAQKYNYGTPVRMMGATHTMILRHGYITVNKNKYGVLNPQLYGEIVDGKKTDFFIAPITSTGFAKGIVVNCSN